MGIFVNDRAWNLKQAKNRRENGSVTGRIASLSFLVNLSKAFSISLSNMMEMIMQNFE